jgi:hypothetical protein
MVGGASPRAWGSAESPLAHRVVCANEVMAKLGSSREHTSPSGMIQVWSLQGKHKNTL